MNSHLPSIAERNNRNSGLRGLIAGLLALALLFGVVPSSAGMAQSDQSIGVEERPLIDRQPFDLIILTQAAGGHRVPIATLPERAFPQRPTDATKLEVVLLSHLDRRYEITWRDIEKIEFYEQMVYDEALKKMASKDYIGAFQNLSFLLQNYPQMPELENLRRKFLFQSAATMFGDGKLLQTMSTLEELRGSAPNYEANNVINGLSRITDAVIKSYVDKNDLSSALKVLDRLEQQYGDAIPSVKTWRDDLNKRADMQLARAKEMMEQHKYREARKSISALLSLYPRHTVGLQLMEQLNKEHPMIRVGVMQRGTEPDPSSLISRPARRVGNLTRRALFEFLQTGPEGGKYGFAFGTFRQSEDRQQLTLTFDPSQKSQVTPQQISQILLRRAKVSNPEYDPSWAAILKSVSIPNSQQVLLTLQRPHVLPHSLLQLPLMDEEGKDLIPGPYNVGSADEDENSFVIRNRDPGSSQPVEVVEHFYQDAKVAVNDLLRGELDVLDQVFPADARRLATLERVKIASYALPSVHMLLPISDYPYLEKDKFRRALLYAVDRTNVLSGELLGGTSSPDGRVVSGPFPMGSDSSDPLSYAYDPSVKPMPYDPRLAKFLQVLVDEEFKASAAKFGDPIPEKRPLKLGVPDFELAKVAAQAIVQQWIQVGIKAEIVVLPPGKSTAPELGYDLLYVMADMWEPATDIERLIGEGGPGATDNPYIVQGLTRLRSARNWREVRDALQDLHALIDYHLPLLPLWQITDRFAYVKNLEGPQSGQITLYQTIGSWQIPQK